MSGATIICGATERPPRPPAHLSDEARSAWADRWLYHDPDGRYRSTVGMPYTDADGQESYACVGCWWCEGEADAVAEVVFSEGYA